MRLIGKAALSSLWCQGVGLLLGLLMLSAPVSAQLVVLDSALQGHYLGDYLQGWEDVDRDADLAVAQRQDYSALRGSIPNLGHTGAAYWFRLELQSGFQSESWVAVVSNKLLDQVDVYTVAADGTLLDLYRGGASRPQTGRSIPHRHTVIPIRLQGHHNVTLYFRVTSSSSLQFPLQIWPLSEFIEQDEGQTLLTGLLIGTLVIMLLYNFFLYTALRDPLYLVYVGSVTGFTLLQLCTKGFGYRFLWAQYPQLSAMAVFIAGFATVFFATTFVSGFLRLKQRRFFLLPVVNLCRWGALLQLVLCWFVPDLVNVVLLVGLATLAITLGFIAIANYYQAGDRPVQIFTAAWLVLLLGTLLFLANKLGVIPINDFTEQTMAVGLLIEVILFSMALGDRINNEKDQALRARQQELQALNAERVQQQNILRAEATARQAREATNALQLENNQRLEAEVAQRTAELEQVNRELEQLVRIDPLTGAFNRRCFNESLPALLNRAQQDECGLSLLMIDLDHFKSINDTYGHGAGDQCLMQVAQCIQRLLPPERADLVRYGGEEFAVILSASDMQGALELAERLRLAVTRIQLQGDAMPERISLSIGVASSVPGQATTPGNLLAQADAALYRAKAGGRNQVQVQTGEQERSLG